MNIETNLAEHKERYKVSKSGWKWIVTAGRGSRVLYSSFFYYTALRVASIIDSEFQTGYYLGAKAS
jgi:hypothetical protein